MRWVVVLGWILATATAAWGQSATLAIRPSVIVGAPGSTVDVPVVISSPDRISIIRMTLEYNTTAATFVDARVGVDAQAANFTIVAVNPNLPFAPKTPGTNENVLVLTLSGVSTWITGNNKELVVLRFALATGGCKQSPINFDFDCNHTDGSTYEGNVLCGANLVLHGGALANGCVTDVAPPANSAFELRQNVPNPFNPNTSISFDLVNAASVCLRVFGVDGALIRVLLDGANLQAGPHDVIWDGRDSRGKYVHSGVYYYQMRVGDATSTRPMVLLK